ncbi:hypothetical protein G9464_02750 [Halostella sp. JP-L12]|uniref:hypothetical protein n=1 Tax=Halostella TaxID=1843185 RepID=UPI000EF7C333|nr:MULTISPECIES: hypothetical protein [Halostella]NHN46516.1 hypothetical protein [Halostella sp. JP-L12]
MTDDADLERRLDAVEAAVHDLEEQLSTATNRDIPLLKGTVRTLVATEVDSLDDLSEAGRTFRRRCADREKCLQAVETKLETLCEAGTAASTKAEKYGAILAFAQNKRNGSAKLVVSPSEIMRYTGVSRRYAYDLLAEISADVDGVRVWEATENPTGSNVKRKVLLVDCEHVHAATKGMNQFTTGGRRNDEERAWESSLSDGVATSSGRRCLCWLPRSGVAYWWVVHPLARTHCVSAAAGGGHLPMHLS